MVNRLQTAIAITLGLFFIVLMAVITNHTISFDESILRTLNNWSNPVADQFFQFVTYGGDPRASLMAAALGVAVFIAIHRYRDGMVVGIMLVGANAISSLLKLAFERQRPELWQQLVHESSFSFPSGHAIASVAISFSVLYLLRHWRYRKIAVFMLVIYVALIGLSRLYLGVHYPTDVLGGWLISSAWCCFVMNWFNRRVASSDQTSK